jgi:hypothetical protein
LVKDLLHFVRILYFAVSISFLLIAAATAFSMRVYKGSGKYGPRGMMELWRPVAFLVVKGYLRNYRPEVSQSVDK